MTRSETRTVEQIGADILRCTECEPTDLHRIERHWDTGRAPRGIFIEPKEKMFSDVELIVVGQNPGRMEKGSEEAGIYVTHANDDPTAPIEEWVKSYREIREEVEKVCGKFGKDSIHPFFSNVGMLIDGLLECIPESQKPGHPGPPPVLWTNLYCCQSPIGAEFSCLAFCNCVRFLREALTYVLENDKRVLIICVGKQVFRTVDIRCLFSGMRTRENFKVLCINHPRSSQFRSYFVGKDGQLDAGTWHAFLEFWEDDNASSLDL